MERGPLPLGDTLRCARDIANHLRELHEDGRVHGEVGAEFVVLRQSGCLLTPPTRTCGDAGHIADVAAFGSLLYEMLTSRKPTTEALLSTPLQAAPRKGPGAVYSAAVRLAERCLTAVPENVPSMQKVLTELRLLSVQVRQFEPADRTADTNLNSHGGKLVGGKLAAGNTAAPPESPTGEEESDPAVGPESGEDAENPAAPKSGPKGGDPEEDLMADGKCPRCRCSKVRVSRPRNRIERFLRALGLPVRRCHRCYFRYIDLFKACLEMPTKKFNR
jgi:hypothetical protein